MTLPRKVSNKDETFQLLFVGRIRVEKGILVILKALDLLLNEMKTKMDLPSLHLHIIGDGDELYISELQTFLKEKRLSNIVTFHGKIPQDDLITYYDRSDLMLVPSLWQEPFGLVVAEAMARRLPVIASNIGGPAEIITNEINGLLFEAGDERALALAIMELINNPEKRERIGQAAHSTVQDRFVIEENVRRIEQHLQQAVMETKANSLSNTMVL